MIKVKRTITKDGWSVIVKQFTSNSDEKAGMSIPSAGVYIGGVQKGGTRVVVWRSYLMWLAMIAPNGHARCPLWNRLVARSTQPKPTVFGLRYRYSVFSAINTGIAPAQCEPGTPVPTRDLEHQDWTALIEMGKVARLIKDGMPVLDWLAENGPPVVTRMLHDETFGSQFLTVEEYQQILQGVPDVVSD